MIFFSGIFFATCPTGEVQFATVLRVEIDVPLPFQKLWVG